MLPSYPNSLSASRMACALGCALLILAGCEPPTPPTSPESAAATSPQQAPEPAAAALPVEPPQEVSPVQTTTATTTTVVEAAAGSEGGAEEHEPAPERDHNANMTLLISADGRSETVAQLTFKNNELTRTEYITEDRATRAAFQKHLDAVLRTAKERGLFIKFHRGGGPGERGGLYGAKPKPGEARFGQAMSEHLGKDGFDTTVERFEE